MLVRELRVRDREPALQLRVAERLLVELRDAGVDYDDVVETLEREGVEKFAASFDELLEGIRAKKSVLAAA